MAARLFTCGYKLYAPNVHILYHLSSRELRPTFWEQFETQTKYDVHAPHLQKKTNSKGQSSNAPTKTSLVTWTNTTPGAMPRSQFQSLPTPIETKQGSRTNGVSSSSHFKKAEVDKETRITRKYLEQQGYNRIQDLLLYGKNADLYSPQPSKQHKTVSIGKAADSNGLPRLVLDAEDAKSDCYGLGNVYTLAQFEEESGVFISKQKIYKRARFGLSSESSGTDEESLKHIV